MADDLIREFLRTVNPSVFKRVRPEMADSGACWNWQGVVMYEYGYYRFQGRNIRATHVSLALDGQGFSNGRVAMHSCDNPRCVNPKHLRWGTQKQNMQDMIKKSRHSSGEAHANVMRQKFLDGSYKPRRKLSDEQVAQIRSDTRLQKVIAAAYGISSSYVSQLKSFDRRQH